MHYMWQWLGKLQKFLQLFLVYFNFTLYLQWQFGTCTCTSNLSTCTWWLQYLILLCYVVLIETGGRLFLLFSHSYKSWSLWQIYGKLKRVHYSVKSELSNWYVLLAGASREAEVGCGKYSCWRQWETWRWARETVWRTWIQVVQPSSSATSCHYNISIHNFSVNLHWCLSRLFSYW